MLRDVYFYGHLETRYGRHLRFDVDSPAEVVRAMQANYGDFFQAIQAGRYQIVRGVDLEGEHLCERHLTMSLGSAALHIIPVIEGAGGGVKGVLTAVLGVALIASAVIMSGGTMAGLAGTAFTMPGALGGAAITWGQVGLLGGVLALGGVAQLMTPTPRVGDYDREQKRTNFLFNGAINRMEQGGALPVIYGKFRVGSVTVSAGIDIENGADPGESEQYRDIVVNSVGPGGYVSPYGGTYRLGSGPVTLHFVAEWPYEIETVEIDGVSQGAISSYTWPAIMKDYTVVLHTQRIAGSEGE